MESRETIIAKFFVGEKLQCMFDKFNPIEEGILTVSEIDPVNFILYLTKENGAKIIKPLGASYKYNLDDKYFEIIHNDRVTSWTAAEKYKIIPGGNPQ